MNVLFKLSENVEGFEDKDSVENFFTKTLVEDNQSYFHSGKKMVQLQNDDKIYFAYKGEIIARAVYSGDFQENNQDDFPFGYKVFNIELAKKYINIKALYPTYFKGQAAARYVDNNKYLQDDLDSIFNDKSSHKNTIQEKKMPKKPLNQILYGPPGTGKTYNTINKAIEIVDNEFYQLHKEETSENRKALKDKFDEYKKVGQIEFITFHQSYGYEEFVEGIKAETTKKENIKYEIKAGIFKRLCEKAIKNKVIYNDDSFENKIEKYRDLIDKETITLQTATGVHFTLKKSPYGISTQTDHSFAIQKLIQINNSILNSNPDYTYGKFIVEDINRKFPNNSPNQNYILIIDEINRGNISKIFGELITLIEPSKRIGEDEEIRVKLPYSGENSEPFGVPSNLYIIGTMNTADRSIAQIDTALRRRFVFEEMMPKPELLQNIVIEDTNINVKKILEAINERIEYIYDREHTIGHSYFLPLLKTPTKEQLDEIFRVNIIPLLAEYFYGDWADIEFILNNNFIQEKKIKLYIKEDTRQFNRVYEVNGIFDTPQYIKIYNAASE